MLKPCSSPQVAALKRLIDHRAERQRSGRFFTEGVRFVRRALDAGRYPIDVVYLCPELLRETPGASRLIDDLDRAGVARNVLSIAQYHGLSPAAEPPGVAALCRGSTARLAGTPPEPIAVALDTIRSPGNLGTLLRTMEATGATTLFLLGDAIDPFNPKTVRATMGSLFGVRIVRTSPDAFDRWRARHGVALVGTSPNAGLDSRTFEYPPRCVLWLGGERKGLSDAQQASCDSVVRIPMCGPVDSLNVGVAGSVLLYEVYYQRFGGA